jgi:Arc/MetJ-type ribon-helix-helix transcriptional regulator
MEIKLNAEQKEFVRRAVETGRARKEEDAIKQALDLWVERERRREELLALIDKGDASLAAGEVRTIEAGSAKQLAEEVHQRGMARLAAKRSKRA